VNWHHSRASADESRVGWTWRYVSGSVTRDYDILMGFIAGGLMISINASATEFPGKIFVANYQEAGRSGYWKGPKVLLDEIIKDPGNLPPECADLLVVVRDKIETGQLVELLEG
jgi:hypothetical protein